MNGKVKNFGVRQSLRNSCWRQAVRQLGGGLRTEDALEAGASELDAGETLAIGLGSRDMDYAATSGEVAFVAESEEYADRNGECQSGNSGTNSTREETK